MDRAALHIFAFAAADNARFFHITHSDQAGVLFAGNENIVLQNTF